MESNTGVATARAVERAIDIMSCFTRQTPLRGIAEISSQTGLSGATVHRLLTALESRRCVEQDPVTGKYRLGIRLLEYAGVILDQLSYQEKAYPHLQQVVQETDETAVLATLDDLSHVCTLVIESPRTVRVSTSVGMRRPAYFGAGGQALLAWQPEDALDRLLPVDRLESFTRWSVTDPIEYRRRLKTVREQGYGVERGESFPDVTGLAAPIFDQSGQVIAAAVLITPTHRVPDERIPVLLACLLEGTTRISADLGAPSHLRQVNVPVRA